MNTGFRLTCTDRVMRSGFAAMRRPGMTRWWAVASGVHARNLKENVRLQFLLIEAVLHQIADADDAFESVAVDHRQVADAGPRHRRPRGVHTIRRVAAYDRRGHQFADLVFERRRALAGDRSDKIALREDADRLHPAFFDNQGADAPLHQLVHRAFDAVGRVYPHDVAAFDSQNIGNKHDCLLICGSRPRKLSSPSADRGRPPPFLGGGGSRWAERYRRARTSLSMAAGACSPAARQARSRSAKRRKRWRRASF